MWGVLASLLSLVAAVARWLSPYWSPAGRWHRAQVAQAAREATRRAEVARLQAEYRARMAQAPKATVREVVEALNRLPSGRGPR